MTLGPAQNMRKKWSVCSANSEYFVGLRKRKARSNPYGIFKFGQDCAEQSVSFYCSHDYVYFSIRDANRYEQVRRSLDCEYRQDCESALRKAIR